MNSENNPYLLINPFDKTIAPVYFDGELSSLYAMLQCCCVAVASCGKYDLFVDDEGLLKPASEQRYFIVEGYPQPLAGMALAVGCDDEGNTIPPDITLEELEAQVLFVEAIIWEDG